MKTLSVKNPWAHLIIYNGKDVENRSWMGLWEYTGEIPA
jgi:hypothetical protein